MPRENSLELNLKRAKPVFYVPGVGVEELPEGHSLSPLGIQGSGFSAHP